MTSRKIQALKHAVRTGLKLRKGFNALIFPSNPALLEKTGGQMITSPQSSKLNHQVPRFIDKRLKSKDLLRESSSLFKSEESSMSEMITPKSQFLS